MEAVRRMLSIPLDFPSEVMEYAERDAQGNARRLGYLQAVEDDIVLRIFMYRKLKGKEFQITEVMRRITREKRWAIKNVYGNNIGGYHAVYEEKNKTSYCHGYSYLVFDKEDFDVWHIREDNVLNLWFFLINVDMLKDTQFKYCGYNTSVTDDVIGYLNKYIEHPCVEYFGKLGINPSPTLIKKAEKDKAFRSWLYRNNPGRYGTKATIYAYDHNISLSEAAKYLNDKAYYGRWAASSIPEIKGTKIDRKKAMEYIQAKKCSGSSYSDYLKALKKLKYDLTDTKNIFPHNFKRMHDLRIAEYDSVIAKEDQEKRAALYSAFEKKAQEAKRFEYKGECYVAMIPAQIQELIREGRELHHCVGKMGYDKKMADGKVIIVFIRSLLDIAKPLVTIEYDLKNKRISQAHGDYNSAPTDEQQSFIDEWEKRTTKLLKAG